MTSTERIYYVDSYARSFRARVVTSEPGRVCLDRTAFYPTSGGQPFDTGSLGGIEVSDVVDDGDVVWHIVDHEVAGEVDCLVNWPRRFDHMQQHTGQHLLSAVAMEEFGWETLSFHMGAEVSTVELRTPGISRLEMVRMEELANARIAESRPVSIRFEDSESAAGLRKASGRTGTLRLIEIDRLDRSACGGTHVRNTSEIGCLLLREVEKVRGNARLSFVCGGRAVKRSRQEFDVLAEVARVYSSPWADAGEAASRQSAKLVDAEKRARTAELAAASFEGAELYRTTEPAASGLRVHCGRAEQMRDAARHRAQSFTAGSRAVYVGIAGTTVLLAVSADSGLHAGNLLKEALAANGGRGGGAALLAQGSAPTPELAGAVVQTLLARVVPA